MNSIEFMCLFLTGTMGFEIEGKLGEFVEEKGGLYSISGNSSTGYTVNQHLDKITLSNGLAWSLDHSTFYYIDSMKYRISAYDYDIKSGSISNPRTVLDFKQKMIPGIPDGMTVDSEGKLIVAVFAGGCVLRIDPDSGDVLAKIQVPAPQVTSIAFGGDNFDELYVTTANIYATPETQEMFPDAGSVYRLTNLGFKGVRANKVKL
ncbi:regucalcin [Nilaparvata lugens]|uniref:regucalcin n=1 Tax=Nilaparvata lugens TaxID=108931 RepID=UPI00193E6D5D|nr:regucalcin [Nilaparvata lugens]